MTTRSLSMKFRRTGTRSHRRDPGQLCTEEVDDPYGDRGLYGDNVFAINEPSGSKNTSSAMTGITAFALDAGGGLAHNNLPPFVALLSSSVNSNEHPLQTARKFPRASSPLRPS